MILLNKNCIVSFSYASDYFFKTPLSKSTVKLKKFSLSLPKVPPYNSVIIRAMKQLIFLHFCLAAFLYTEGGYAQGVFEKKDIAPSPTDSSYYSDALDSLDQAFAVPQKPYKSPYLEAQKAYLSEPIEAKTVDTAIWNKAKEGLDYSNDKLKKEKPTQTSFNPLWAVVFEFLKWFFIIGAVVLLAYLILRFVGEGNIFSSRKRRLADPSVQIDLDNVEENLETAELDPLIRQAILDKNFTLAVRLYYLAILKELHLKGDIAWKKDKTNRTYLGEMRENRFFEAFRTATSIFEKVWYGSQTIDERSFTVIQPDFQSLLKGVRV